MKEMERRMNNRRILISLFDFLIDFGPLSSTALKNLEMYWYLCFTILYYFYVVTEKNYHELSSLKQWDLCYPIVLEVRNLK
jgi:hypothetical protein